MLSKAAMDLSYGPEYEAFRAELRGFLEANRARAPKAGFGELLLIDPALAAWQQLLIEHFLEMPNLEITVEEARAVSAYLLAGDR